MYVYILYVAGKSGAFDSMHILDENCLSRLEVLIKATNSHVVMTSTWRLNIAAMEVLLAAFEKHYIPKPIGVTEDLESICKGDRAREIETWIEKNNNNNKNVGLITHWVAIDDMVYMYIHV